MPVPMLLLAAQVERNVLVTALLVLMLAGEESVVPAEESPVME